MKENKMILAILLAVLCFGCFSVFSPIALGTCGVADNVCVSDCIPPDPDCACASVPGSAGLVPCGKSVDDPDTDERNECAPCTLCSMILMGQLIIEFLVKMAAVISLIIIAAGGLLYISAAGNQGTIEKAKTVIKYTLIGFVIIFIAWAMIDSILITMGYIDPVGGEWHMMEC